MDVMKIIKNPIVLGLLASVSTYIYLKWQNDIKYKDDPKLKKPIDLLIPSVIGFCVFLLVAGYNQYDKCNVPTIPTHINILLSDAMPFDNPTSHLIGNVPSGALPDVFLEAF